MSVSISVITFTCKFVIVGGFYQNVMIKEWISETPLRNNSSYKWLTNTRLLPAFVVAFVESCLNCRWYAKYGPNCVGLRINLQWQLLSPAHQKPWTQVTLQLSKRLLVPVFQSFQHPSGIIWHFFPGTQYAAENFKIICVLQFHNPLWNSTSTSSVSRKPCQPNISQSELFSRWPSWFVSALKPGV